MRNGHFRAAASCDEHLICADQRIPIHDQAENGGWHPAVCL